MILDSVDIKIEADESVSLVGPSGAGKSTLLRILIGLQRPDSGSVLTPNFDVYQSSDEEIARWRLRHVGIVRQNPDLISELTLAENVSVPARFVGVSRSETRSRVADILDQLGIAHLAESRPHQVSGGELQRALVARALINRPSLVVADEPTGALDSENADNVLSLLLSQGSNDRTLLVVTHDMAIAERCDRRLKMLDGRIDSVENA